MTPDRHPTHPGGEPGSPALGRGPTNARATRVGLVVAYQLGRLASYAVFGAAAGAAGLLASRLPGLHGVQTALRSGAALLMLGLGLHLIGAWPRFAAIERVGLPLWNRIEPLARRLFPVRRPGAAFALGVLWGWMPCGLVYAALALALGSGSVAGGALVMLAFGAGTLPTLLTMAAVATGLAAFMIRPAIRRTAGAFVLAFGLLHVAAVGRELALGGGSTAHACCPTALPGGGR